MGDGAVHAGGRGGAEEGGRGLSERALIPAGDCGSGSSNLLLADEVWIKF